MKRLASKLVALLLGTALAVAQQTPDNEALARALRAKALPENAAWRLDFKPGPENALPGGEIRSIVSTRTGEVQRDVITWPDGKTSEAWWFSGDYLAQDPMSGRFLFTPIHKPLNELGWTRWISARNFAGIEALGGKPCAVFRDRIAWTVFWPGFFKNSEGGERVDVEAYFGVDDGQLVALKVDKSLARFAALAAPAEPLEVAPPFVEKRQRIRERMGRKFN